MIVASTIVPVEMRKPLLPRYKFTVSSIWPHNSCVSSRRRKRRIVVSSGAAERPRLTPAIHTKHPRRRGRTTRTTAANSTPAA